MNGYIPTQMERELMNMGVIATQEKPKAMGFKESRAEVKAWHNTLIVDGEVMF